MIKIILQEKYKSFDKDFKTELDGYLIILSGINGSGKSQLMNIIYGQNFYNPNINDFSQNTKKDIERVVLFNGVAINKKDIEIRTFKDNISLPEIVKASSYTFNNAAQQAYGHYTQTQGFSYSNHRNQEFSKSLEKAKKILENAHGSNINNLSEDEFKNTLIGKRFEWKQDDEFSDAIGTIFFNHASNIAQGQQEAGKIDGPAFDPKTLGKAPWIELNELFELLNLEYRFKDNYEIKYGELQETPLLFQIDSSGAIIENETRQLSDLSDGEKAIISLCFTSLRKIEFDDKKILLLDEFDAVLNPSLIEGLFKVIKKYFIDKRIIVIMSTHSPATISLAPEDASYYEVFKRNYSSSRIYKINKEEYLELQKVNKKFYDKISNQEKRIKELEVSIESDADVLIITEGKTDWKYILKALEYFHSRGEFLDIKQEHFYRFGTQEDVKESVCGTKIFADMGESHLIKTLESEIHLRTIDSERRKKVRIGIFDSDTNTKIKDKEDYNVFSFKIEPNGISTEFLFVEDDIKKEVNGLRLFIGTEFDNKSTRHISEKLNLGIDSSKRAGKNEIIDLDVFDEKNKNKALSKEKFAQAVFEGDISISNESWQNFRHIFENIENYLIKQDK